ncbi:MAG: BLUF domain-containing protein [Caldimonas sp.]
MGSLKPFPAGRGESAFLYVSELSPQFARGAVQDIARVSRVHNEASGITGLLLFDGACFAQWLEGSVQAMDHLLARLRADPRHRRMDVLWFESPGHGRRFPQWHFGYLDLRHGGQNLSRLRGTRGADAMLLFGELGRGLVAALHASSGRVSIDAPPPGLRVAREP